MASWDNFGGKAALVTGASSGIGRAVAQGLASAGARLLITGRDDTKLATALAEIGEGHFAISADLSEQRGTASVCAAAARHFSALDILVINAGAVKVQRIEEIDAASFDAIIGLNLRSAFFLVQGLLDLMAAGASIVVTTSVAGQRGMAGTSVYAASKGALRSMVRVLAVELADRGIRINAVSPGLTRTPLNFRMGVSDDEAETMMRNLSAVVPQKRFAEPAEISNVILFLASEAASYVTGQQWSVDGGWTAV